ncbi:MAG: hypothetical protein NTV70_10850 [Acidobacteria bacterium]|nr:hypothetical protein [Acidobacteriota bacterium]
MQQTLATLEQAAQMLRNHPLTGMEEFARLMVVSAGHLHEGLTLQPLRSHRPSFEDSAQELALLTTQIERIRRLLAHAGQLAGEPPPEVAAREASGGTVLGIG